MTGSHVEIASPCVAKRSLRKAAGRHAPAYVLLLLAGGCSNASMVGDGGHLDGPVVPANGMINIPAGSFMMGCNQAMDSFCSSNELPYHQVYLSAFAIDATEVTEGQYASCVAAAACPERPNGSMAAADIPVLGVLWSVGDDFCRWAGKRLPTEAEWEKAARGTDGRIYPWGAATPNCDLANVAGCGTRPQPVGQHPSGASPYGLLDVAGNAFEFVNDRYDEMYYATSPANDPQGPATGTFRLLRGGGFAGSTVVDRVSNRLWIEEISTTAEAGFRCAR